MKESNADKLKPLCPSAQPEMKGSVVFGVVNGTANEPLVGYLNEPQLVTDELLNLPDQIKPTEIFRIAAPCVGTGCKHFTGLKCSLAERTVQLLPEAVGGLPPCKIRTTCRWWQQEGKAACMRCPQVVTEIHRPTKLQCHVADPEIMGVTQAQNRGKE